MARLWFGIVIAVVAFMVYALVDAIMVDRARVRGVPRGVWILIILIIPVLGSVLWFSIGRGRRAHKTVSPSTAPDDDPEFLERLGSKHNQDERIRRLERELADLDESDADDKNPDTTSQPDPPDKTDPPAR
jgi:hypothetical protein